LGISQPAWESPPATLYNGTRSAGQSLAEARKVDLPADTLSDEPYRGRMNLPSQAELAATPIHPENNLPAQPAPSIRPTPGPQSAVESPPRLNRPLPVTPEKGAQQADIQGLPPDSSPVIREIRIDGPIEHTLAPAIQVAPESSRPITSPKVSTIPLVEPAPQPPVWRTEVPAIRASAGIQPLSAPLPVLSVPNPEPPPTPTVNVTIGRIEIRAVPPPATPPRKPASQPKLMSLDDYLKARSNGGQR
jgi:hypothetical protein